MSDTTQFERRIEFVPAFNKRSNDPNKDYGVGAMKIRFLLVGPKGATQFLMGTGWHLPEVEAGLMASEIDFFRKHGRRIHFKADGWDLGYHSPVPLYEGQNKMDCDILPGGCYYDGSSLNAEPVLEAFIRQGDEAVWTRLEEYYHSHFDAEVEA